MIRIITLIFVLLMAIQWIKPLGLPGLEKRKDAWKLAVAGFAVVFIAIMLRPGGWG